MIQNNYSGHIKELLLQIKDLENKLTLVEATMKINEEKYKNEINEQKHRNEILILEHKNEIQTKNIEVLEYKIQLLNK